MKQNRDCRSKPMLYSQLILDKGADSIHSINGVGKIGYPHKED
jgi:hypothetical protein